MADDTIHWSGVISWRLFWRAQLRYAGQRWWVWLFPKGGNRMDDADKHKQRMFHHRIHLDNEPMPRALEGVSPREKLDTILTVWTDFAREARKSAQTVGELRNERARQAEQLRDLARILGANDADECTHVVEDLYLDAKMADYVLDYAGRMLKVDLQTASES